VGGSGLESNLERISLPFCAFRRCGVWTGWTPVVIGVPQQCFFPRLLYLFWGWGVHGQKDSMALQMAVTMFTMATHTIIVITITANGSLSSTLQKEYRCGLLLIADRY